MKELGSIKNIVAVFVLSMIGIILMSGMVTALPLQTDTGFVYPTGVKEPYPYGNWLAGGPGMTYYPFTCCYHIGQDMAADVGTNVLAIADGDVVYVSTGSKSGWDSVGKVGNYGYFVKHKLINGEEFLALYGHVRPINESLKKYTSSGVVSPPIKVYAGVAFATVGPFDSGSHLHFGIHPGAVVPSSPWGRMPIANWSETNGFVDPIEWITTKKPFQPKLDLIFLIDTTGSMWDDIANVKSSSNEIINTLDSKGFDYRVAIADYKDYPQPPYGEPTDYVYKLDLPFTTKDGKQNIVNTINGLSASGGADTPEAVYSALVNAMTDKCKDCINNADNYGWRKGSTKVIIQMGDAPPHMPVEPWPGGHSLDDVISTSKSIDPVIVYSIAIGSDGTAYNAFSEIANGTGGKVYTSPSAEDVVDAINEAIRDIGKPTISYGVKVNVTPASNEVNPEGSASYLANITNEGNVNDTYNLSLELKSFTGFYRGYPTAIQSSWVVFDNSSMGLDPSASGIRPLTVNVPNNWAGMEDVAYSFNVTAISVTDETVSNTSSVELKVKVNKKSMVEYSKLEIQWLSGMINGSSINQGIKNALLAKMANADLKLDQAIANINSGKIKSADNMLSSSENMISAFTNQVEAQYDKKIMQPDAIQLEEKANQILQDLEKAKSS